jgi:hypothetical protein
MKVGILEGRARGTPFGKKRPLYLDELVLWKVDRKIREKKRGGRDSVAVRAYLGILINTKSSFFLL